MNRDWAKALRVAVLQWRLTPKAFWRLTLLEWRMLIAAAGTGALNRQDLDALLARYPDLRRKEASS